MPAVSEKQRRAMFAAAEGKSTLGIPKNVGEEFVGKDDAMHAAGIVHVSPVGRVLLMHRAPDEPNYGGHWGLPGGKAEDGETPEDAARREVKEETGYEHKGDLKPIDRVKTPTGMVFTTFAAPVETEFAPQMADGEHTGFTWADLDHLPQPLHPGVAKVLGAMKSASMSEDTIMAKDSLALDRASIRRTDEDGHLHVSLTPISKAVVNPYRGSEIPDFEKLGLDPNKIYKLLRDPKELEKAAPTFAGKPLLMDHIPVSADDHPKHKTVGSVGSEVQWKPPYLMAPLSVWDRDAIDGIEGGTQKELSSAYRYDPDMTPGTYEGEPYDGIMRNIRGNHVALVHEGRAGKDVVVGDSAMKRDWTDIFALDESEEEKERARGKFSERDKEAASSKVGHREDMPESVFLEPATRKYPVKEKRDGEWKYDRDLLLAAARRARMNGNESLAARADAIRKREFGTAQDSTRKDSPMAKKPLLTRKAAMAQGSLMTYLAPKLAQDAKIDLLPVVRGLTAKNFKAKRSALADAITKATEGKLAADADLQDLDNLLDALQGVEPGEDDGMEANSAMPTAAMGEGEDEDKPMMAKLRAALKGKMSDEEIDKVCEMVGAESAMDEDEEAAKKRAEEEAKKAQDGEAEKMKDMVDKKAMDAAIKAASAATAKEVRATERAIRAAEQAVRPFVGELAMGFDSADDVYRHALEVLGVEDAKTIHSSALPAILAMQPKPGARPTEVTRSLAADASMRSDAAKIAPGLSRIVIGA